MPKHVADTPRALRRASTSGSRRSAALSGSRETGRASSPGPRRSPGTRTETG
jgi:hypothetical protein